MKYTKKYPLMTLRNIVMYPYMVAPLMIGRESSIKALDYALANNKKILLVTQHNVDNDNPNKDEIYRIGVLANILQKFNLADKSIRILVEGVTVTKLDNIDFQNGFFMADAQEIELNEDVNKQTTIRKLTYRLVREFRNYANSKPNNPKEIESSLTVNDPPEKIAYTIAMYLNLAIDQKQALLEENSLSKLLSSLLDHLKHEIDIQHTDSKIEARVKRQMDKSQREYYLNEKIKAIHKELGNTPPNQLDEIKELQNKAEQAGLPENAKKKLDKELGKLKMMSPSSAEASVLRTYIDTVLDVPWKKTTELKTDIKKAQLSLNKDHYGLDEVKTRILEYLAVQQRVGKLKGHILCLVGPPGVGKTSLGASIAKATGRKFIRMALGGVRDEAEIRGHRRTYIGSMPGKIIHNMIKIGVTNPLYLLDEIDKMAQDYRGDPASALLEVLDPEQNHTFNDHYLELDYDLSNVLFVATSNSMNIPAPLLDRMEVIRISGYTEDEKLHIAKNHLIKKQLEKHSLSKKEFSVSNFALTDIIQHYTSEAGVRNLDREIAKLMRKAVRKLAVDSSLKTISISAKNTVDYLGVPKYSHGTANKKNQIGQVTGLAWTSVGGELLTIEAVTVPGKGKFIYTGQLGEIMQESIQAAMSVIRSRADSLGIANDFYETQDIHVHVPEGATPKDGPSAGVGMCTALVSVLSKTKVLASVAMTGEITLRGEVLPIGGLKEKLLAAHRAGIEKIIIPKKNMKDLKEIKENILEGISIIPVNWIDQVWENSLETVPKSNIVLAKSGENKPTSDTLQTH